MFQRPIERLGISWSLGFIALPFGAVYCLLLCLFPDSIEAYVKMRTDVDFSTWGGVEVLFVLNSAGLGWASVVALERRTGAAGPVVLLLALPCCLAAIAGGFALAPLFLGSLSGAMREMLTYSLVSALVASVLRVYLGNIR